MKKIPALAVLLFALAVPAKAQYTQAYGTVIDPNGIPYANATIKAQLVTPSGAVSGQPTVSATCHTADASYPCQLPVDNSTPAIVLNGAGSFLMQMADNALITPAGTSWQFTITTTDSQGVDHGVPPPLGFGAVSFTVTVTVTGAGQDLTTSLSGAALALSRVFSGGGPGGTLRLDQVADPNISKSFNLGTTTLSFSNGAVDFSATSLAMPANGTFVATSTAQYGRDSTLQNIHVWRGADAIAATFLASDTLTDGDVLGARNTAGTIDVQDLGSVNAPTGTSFLKMLNTDLLDGDIHCYDSTAIDPTQSWPNCTPGTVGTAIIGAANAYTVAITDNETIIDHDAAGSASVTVTLPTADTLTIPAFGFKYTNHSTHADTITPTTWTINGAASLPVPANAFCLTWVDPNSTTNWLADCTAPVPATVVQTIASGTVALGTSAIASGTCATVVGAAATGTLTTDNILADFNADPTSTTGYNPATGMLTIVKYPSSGNVNFKVCNVSGLSITPGAVTLNWRVFR
jgi:hypothetical protein